MRTTVQPDNSLKYRLMPFRARCLEVAVQVQTQPDYQSMLRRAAKGKVLLDIEQVVRY